MTPTGRRLIVLGLLVWMVPLTRLPIASGRAGQDYVVELRPGTGVVERDRALGARGLRLVEAAPGFRFVRARAAAGERPSRKPGGVILSVHEPVVHRALGVPDDPHYALQWHMTAVQAEEAWNSATGDGVTVAVLDTGVATSAPDLAGTRFVTGHDWIEDDAIAQDENGHGTHVAGTIAQTTSNRLGGAGLAYRASIMPLRVLDAEGAGTDYDIALGLHYAADAGATVVNMSLGAPESSPVMQAAVSYAASKGVVLVGAAGNDGVASLAYPAAYPEVIAVGAVRFDRNRSPYSNTGAGLGLVAPGGDTSVDQNNDGYGDGVLQQTFDGQPGQWCYCFYQGTSMAAPHVAAAAALIASTGVRDRLAIRTALESSALDLGPAGRDDQFGWGMLQAADALAAARAAPAPSTPSPPSTPPAPAPTPDAPGSSPEPVPAPTPEPVQVNPVPHDVEDACPVDRTPRQRFSDVDAESVHARAIDCVAWLEIAHGTGGSAYSPDRLVTRDQMASFLVRMIERAGRRLPDNPPDAFGDDEGNVHEAAINRLAALGVVQGTSARSYGPRQGVSRGALATFVTRAYDLLAQRDLPAAGDFFDDDAGNVHEEQIDRAASPGITTGVGLRIYRPGNVVTRAQMATFLARTLDTLVDEDEAPPP